MSKPDFTSLVFGAIFDAEASGKFSTANAVSGCKASIVFSSRTDSHCGRALYKDSEHCFWHSTDIEKFMPENLRLALGDISLLDAVEKEVAAGRSLENAVLAGADFGGNFLRQGPSLRGGRFDGANLQGSSLSYADLTDAVFARADLSGAKLSETTLSGTQFQNARLFHTKFRGSDLSTCKGLRRSSFRGFMLGFIPIERMSEIYPDQAEPMYLELVRYFSTRGLFDDASWAAYRASTLRHKLLRARINLAVHRSKRLVSDLAPSLVEIKAGIAIEWPLAIMAWLRSAFFKWITGWGERPMRVIAAAMLTMLVYAASYRLPGGPARDFVEALYFSTITFATVGYGDIYPHGIFRLVAGSEGLAGIFLSGMFLFCLGRRSVARW